MRELWLVACQPRPYRLTTSADPAAAATPDLVGRDYTAAAPGSRLVAADGRGTPTGRVILAPRPLPSGRIAAERSTDEFLSDIITGVEYAGFSWTAGARKFRVSRAQVRHIVGHAGLFFVRPAAPPQRPDEALLFLGDDEDGMPVEVVGVELAGGWLRVIHAMPMRPAYHDLYEEAKKWRQ